jgi:hypothetical protein
MTFRLMDSKQNRSGNKMKTTNKMKTRKTIYILAALLGLQFNILFAAEKLNDSRVLMSTTAGELNVTALAPVTPADADFSDEAPASETSILNLAPITPREADFDDATTAVTLTSIIELAPVTPATADFEDHV